ncbi:unnamed protein product [Brugia pahangi]|uniref:Hemopexin domain-containing protein n=1 Tax=Brugia pahangi TaxID=6280 RepID=A0A0N4T1P5_BRUPA|nr:unnamed protein product [Brugia pahangi]
MFVQLLQFIIIIYYIAEARIPLTILSKLKNQYDMKDYHDNIQKSITAFVTFQNYNCPKKIDSATEGKEIGNFLKRHYKFKLINMKYCYHFIRNDLYRCIFLTDFQIFRGGPHYVNASVSTKHQTYLIADRNIKRSLKEKFRSFSLIKGWPKMLPNRVLFFPQAAFPLENESAVLVSGNVLAAYELKHNKVISINDLERCYPNLPEDFRTGVPFPTGQFNTYYFLDSHNLYEYNMNTKRIIFSQPLKKYLLC